MIMDHTQRIAQAADAANHRAAARRPTAKKGVVSAVLTGPPRVVVNGREMPYLASYTTPAVNDAVAYAAGPDPICFGKIAS